MKLSKFLKERDLTCGEFGDQVGATAEAVRLWASDQRIPKKEFMEKIAAATDGTVLANDFFNVTAA